jgi:hypothetical protein
VGGTLIDPGGEGGGLGIYYILIEYYILLVLISLIYPKMGGDNKLYLLV